MPWKEPQQVLFRHLEILLREPRRYTAPLDFSIRLSVRMTNSNWLNRLGSPAQEAGTPCDGARNGQDQRRLAQATGQLGIAAGGEKPPGRQEDDLVVLPVVQHLPDHPHRHVGVHHIDGHIEDLDPLH